MLQPSDVTCESTVPGAGSGTCELTNLDSIWSTASGKDQHGAAIASPCPAAYTLVVFDGTWQEAKEIHKVLSFQGWCLLQLSVQCLCKRRLAEPSAGGILPCTRREIPVPECFLTAPWHFTTRSRNSGAFRERTAAAADLCRWQTRLSGLRLLGSFHSKGSILEACHLKTPNTARPTMGAPAECRLAGNVAIHSHSPTSALD